MSRQKIISFVNQKGGTGKTTAAVSIGAGLLKEGYKTLLVDLDPQANTTISLGIDPTKVDSSMYEVLLQEVPLGEILMTSSSTGVELAPARKELSNTDLNLATEKNNQLRLKEALKDLKDKYDFILIDCPPSLSLLSVNALAASNGVLIPILCDYLSLEGLKQLMDSISLIKKRINQELKIVGILPNMVDFRLKLTHESLDLVRNHFKELIFDNIVRTCVRLKEAPSFGKSIFTYAPHSIGVENYHAVVKEMLERVRRI